MSRDEYHRPRSTAPCTSCPACPWRSGSSRSGRRTTPASHRRCRPSRHLARLEPLVQVAAADAQLAVGQLAALGSPAFGAPLVERRALDPQLLAHLGERELLIR